MPNKNPPKAPECVFENQTWPKSCLFLTPTDPWSILKLPKKTEFLYLIGGEGYVPRGMLENSLLLALKPLCLGATKIVAKTRCRFNWSIHLSKTFQQKSPQKKYERLKPKNQTMQIYSNSQKFSITILMHGLGWEYNDPCQSQLLQIFLSSIFFFNRPIMGVWLLESGARPLGFIRSVP